MRLWRQFLDINFPHRNGGLRQYRWSYRQEAISKFFLSKIQVIMHRKNFDKVSMHGEEWAKPTQQNYFGHQSSSDSHRWQGRKATIGQSYKDMSFIIYNRTFSRLNGLQRAKILLTELKSIYVVLKAVITSYLLFCTSWWRYLFLRWLNASDISVSPFVYIPPSHKLAGVVVDFSSRFLML